MSGRVEAPVSAVDRSLAHAVPALDALECASGIVLGARRSPREDDPTASCGASPRELLEQILLPALERTPCLVAFSGGRDSSAMLAVAVDAARRHGFDDPVPITIRYGGDTRTHEDEWQAAVIRHLGLREREVLHYTDEADALGSVATDVLRRHGRYWPAGIHVAVPLMRAARGGALVTGVGGDELFSPWEHRRLSLIRSGRLRPARRDMKQLALAVAPPRMRATFWRRRRPLRLPWLTEKANRRLAAGYADERNRDFQRTWAGTIETYLDSRYREVTRGTFSALAKDVGTLPVEPFMDRSFVRAVMRHAPPEGFQSRQAGLSMVASDLLPDELLGRSTKAVFTDVFWGRASRAFAERWDGSGLDPALVLPDALRAEWAKPRPDFRSVSALHAAWLAAQGSDGFPTAHARGRPLSSTGRSLRGTSKENQ